VVAGRGGVALRVLPAVREGKDTYAQYMRIGGHPGAPGAKKGIEPGVAMKCNIGSL
jgi:hypothetical protein